MPNWDADSPRLRQNLESVLESVRDDARARTVPSLEDARRWQRETMAGLIVPDPRYVGQFRGEPGIRKVEVTIGGVAGTPARQVSSELRKFESTLQSVAAALDAKYAAGAELDADGLAAAIDLAAWAHAEWVRIHPFANGNGRTARLWANYLLMRYGIPPAVRLRPRPDGGYAAASSRAMSGDWKLTAVVFHRLVQDAAS